MTMTSESMLQWCRRLMGFASDAPRMSFEDYVKSVPTFDTLADLPSGTAVLVRGDVDAKPGAKIGDGDIRLRSMVETLNVGREKGWKQIIFGHIGRKAEGSLNKVQARLAELLKCEIPLISDWYDDATDTILPAAAADIAKAPAGSILLLENTRKYDIERVLWKAKDADLPALAEKLAKYSNELATKVAQVYVHEALSAGSLDSSSVIAPAAMQQAVLGKYVAGELAGPMMRCREAELVVFSGIKTDKLDDLEAIVQRGKVRMVISAGSLAMALFKAKSIMEGKEVSLGLSEDPTKADQPFYIAPERVQQARRILETGKQHGVEFVLPADFVLSDGNSVHQLAPTDQQFDVGPLTTDLCAQPDWVTHTFTAGGTVLNALGAEPIPYMQALYLACHS